MKHSLEEFNFQKLNIILFKKLLTIIFIFISLLCIITMFPHINSILVSKANSLQSIQLFQTTWQSIIMSFSIVGLIISIIVLVSLYLKYLPRKFWFGLYIVFTFCFLIFISYITFRFGIKWIGSDHSSELVLSKLLAEENTLLTTKWYYSTELRIIYQQIFMVPLFKIFTDWHLIRAITAFLNNLLLLVSYFFFLKQTKIGKKWIMLSSIFLLIPINRTYFDIVTFGGYYVFFLAMFFFCFGLFLIVLEIRESSKSNRIIPFVILSILTFSMGITGIRSFMDIYLPLFLACIFHYYFKFTKNFYIITLSTYLLLVCGIGLLINNFLWFVYNYASDFKVILDDPSQTLFFKFGQIIWFFPAYLGYEGHSFVYTPLGIFSGLSFLLSICLIIIPITFLRKQRKSNGIISFPYIFILFFFLATIIYHIVFYLLINSKYLTIRYFIPVFIFYIPVLSIIYDKFTVFHNSRSSKILITISVIIVMCQGGLKFQQLITSPDLNETRHAYICYLEENGLNFGFATFPNANVTAELSNGKITVAGIDIRNGILCHDNWLTAKKYENPLFSNSTVFVLFSVEEWNLLQKNERFKSEKPVYSDTSFIILTYPSTKVLHEHLIDS